MKIKRLTTKKTSLATIATYSVTGVERLPEMLELIEKVHKTLSNKVEQISLHTENGQIIADNFEEVVKLLKNFGKNDSIGEESLFIGGKINDSRIVIEFPLIQNKFLSVHAKGEEELKFIEAVILSKAKGE